MKRTFILISVFVSLVGLPYVRGQSIGPSTINATGGSGTIGTNEFEWSVGEMTMVSTFTSSTIIVTQGLLQPRTVPVGISTPAFTDNLRVFPNPSNSLVNLQFNSTKEGMLAYKLMDIAGRLIFEKSSLVKQGMNTEQVDISGVAVATYMLQVSFTAKNDAVETTSYKIQKLQ